MQEIGFWDYTCPQHGSLERYTRQDWDVLLEDMAAGGFNSLVLGIKWITTGYASRLEWLDQDPSCSAIASGNELILYALKKAHSLGIHTWLLVVATIYPLHTLNLPGGIPFWTEKFKVYDLDTPGLDERIDLLFSEIVELFGGDTDGLVVELEFCDGEAPHRIPIYNSWARENGRPEFAELKAIRLEPRAYPFTHWRDFTTSRRIETLKRIKSLVRQKGFMGKLTTIIEIDNQPTVVMGNVNLEMFAKELSGGMLSSASGMLSSANWPVVTYDSIYDRRRNRLATMDMCIQQPRLQGMQVYYLTRGVMTFNILPELGPTTLVEQWRMSLEDAKTHQPEILWFMGSDARLDGMVCSHVKLPEWGFADPRLARLRLMEMVKESDLSKV